MEWPLAECCFSSQGEGSMVAIIDHSFPDNIILLSEDMTSVDPGPGLTHRKITQVFFLGSHSCRC